jgi:uncharacterized membrane protein
MIESVLGEFAHAISLSISSVAVLIVAWGAAEAAFTLLTRIVGRNTTHGQRKAVWRRMGVWLLLGLEFELAADIVETVIAPDWTDIGQLGAIAVVRTFLNYFLEKDLAESREAAAEGAPIPETGS